MINQLAILGALKFDSGQAWETDLAKGTADDAAESCQWTF